MAPGATGEKILVMDDDSDMQIFLSTLLESNGFSPSVANDCGEGLQKINKENPSLIIINVPMKERNGITIYQHIKEDDELKNIPVIMLSTIDKRTFFHYQKTQCVTPDISWHEPEAFLEKPPDSKELLKVVNELLVKRVI